VFFRQERFEARFAEPEDLAGRISAALPPVKRPMDLLRALKGGADPVGGLCCSWRWLLRRDLRIQRQCIRFLMSVSWVSQPDGIAGRYFGVGDVLVLPSITEPWGLVVNEAMNSDCP